MVLIKDNHISIAGGISNALRSVDQYLERENLQMEVEVISSDVKIYSKLNILCSGVVNRVGYESINLHVVHRVSCNLIQLSVLKYESLLKNMFNLNFVIQYILLLN